MLILARKSGERIMIGDQVELSVVEVKGDQVKLGIKAPKTVKVYRYEVYSAMQLENLAASIPHTIFPSVGKTADVSACEKLIPNIFIRLSH